MLMRVIYFFYDCLWLVLLPMAVIRLYWKARHQPQYVRNMAERFAFYRHEQLLFAHQNPIWVHAVSVGETRAAQPLIEELLKRGESIVLTHMTVTGRAAGAQVYAQAIQSGRLLQLYLPYDFSWLVKSFYQQLNLKMGLIMETEVWPRLLLEAETKKLNVFLVNARLSEKSFKNFSNYGFLAQSVLRKFKKILAQTTLDENRFMRLGCDQVVVVGNLKFDVTANQRQVDEAIGVRKSIDPHLVLFCAASTRESEESQILDAWSRFATKLPELYARARLMIVPRHPERFDSVADMIKMHHALCRRSSTDDLAGHINRGAVILGDTMGQMSFYYALCDVVMMGGSFEPLGGQNFIESCALGRPVILGPHTFNFQQASMDAIEANAALRVDGTEGLVHAMGLFVQDQSKLERMSVRALDFSARHAGATARVIEALALSQ